jgi:hypothetical protein
MPYLLSAQLRSSEVIKRGGFSTELELIELEKQSLMYIKIKKRELMFLHLSSLGNRNPHHVSAPFRLEEQKPISCFCTL